ncbi:hypothetical protein ACTHAL_000488, partial [Priestia flexa]|uniref:hypothetical protein n=1 Tax=Priestia flexa TaxID=86664 RepID=UPI003F853A62
VELKDGNKLIGYVVEMKRHKLTGAEGMLFSKLASDGIWLKRERHVSYLSNDSIKLIRESLPFEKEIDLKV